MAWTWSELMIQMNTYHLEAREDWYDAEWDIDKAWEKYGIPDDHIAINYLCRAADHLLNIHLHSNFWYPYGLNGFDSMQEALFKLTDARLEDAAPEVNLDMIINAMLSAEPAQVEYFVGLVDAYRQSIWNKPFNQEFFAALARGFEQWE